MVVMTGTVAVKLKIAFSAFEFGILDMVLDPVKFLCVCRCCDGWYARSRSGVCQDDGARPRGILDELKG